MKTKTYNIKNEVIKYPGESGAWYFVGVGEKNSKEIKEEHSKKTKGFGSVRVTVIVGATIWNTSIFPSIQAKMYMLPIKAAIRKKEGIYEGDKLKYILQMVN